MTWNDIREEIASTRPEGKSSPYDVVRRAKVVAAEAISGIPLIIYAADFVDEGRAAQYAGGVQIDLGDKTGFLQAISDIEPERLDVLVHSPGGSPTATESIVRLLRSRFTSIRVLVPHTAKSAATMLALAADEILLGDAGELGPIDPQLRIGIDQRIVTVPAGAAIDQFERIHREVTANPNAMRGWLPIIRQYGPSFLQECHNVVELSQELAADWLGRYMFSGEPDAEARAKRVAAWLANHGNFKSHSRPVRMDQLLELDGEIKIRTLRDVDEEFSAAIMDVYWAIDATFNGTPACKIIEHSSSNTAYIVQQMVGQIQQAPQPRPQPAQARNNQPGRAQHKKRRR